MAIGEVVAVGAGDPHVVHQEGAEMPFLKIPRPQATHQMSSRRTQRSRKRLFRDLLVPMESVEQGEHGGKQVVAHPQPTQQGLRHRGHLEGI